MKRIILSIFALLLISAGAAQAQITNLYTQSSSSDASLILSGNVLYGMNERGGKNFRGDVYSIHTDGTNYTDLYDFADTGHYAFKCSGEEPFGSLILVGNTLFGVTESGGLHGDGTVFSLHTDGSNYRDLFDFADTGSVAHDNYSGYGPYCTLTALGSRLFGYTYYGGLNGWGTLFRIDTSYSLDSNRRGYKELWNFNRNSDSNGGYPFRGVLIPSVSGNVLFGMTGYGGKNNVGNIFRIDTSGKRYHDIWDFQCCGVGGSYPYGSVTLSGAKLFGMTYEGGGYDYGTIFTVDTTGHNFKELMDFDYSHNGGRPYGDLTLSGNFLYGMTDQGGFNGDGIIFSIDTIGNEFKDIFDFDYYVYGGDPEGDVLLSAGTLYGTTSGGGPYNDGTVFSYDLCSLLMVSHDSTADNGTSNGTAKVNVSGGPMPYSFSWAPGGQTTQLVTGLSAGTYTVTVTDANGCKNTSMVTITSTAGVNNIAANSGQISLYPNPNNGNFTVSVSGTTNKSTVEVYNMLGEKVFAQSLTLGNNNMDMNAQANGVYMYRIVSDNGNLVGQGKLLIQK